MQRSQSFGDKLKGQVMDMEDWGQLMAVTRGLLQSIYVVEIKK
jgi:hypothetical protein